MPQTIRDARFDQDVIESGSLAVASEATMKARDSELLPGAAPVSDPLSVQVTTKRMHRAERPLTPDAPTSAPVPTSVPLVAPLPSQTPTAKIGLILVAVSLVALGLLVSALVHLLR